MYRKIKRGILSFMRVLFSLPYYKYQSEFSLQKCSFIIQIGNIKKQNDFIAENREISEEYLKVGLQESQKFLGCSRKILRMSPVILTNWYVKRFPRTSFEPRGG